MNIHSFTYFWAYGRRIFQDMLLKLELLGYRVDVKHLVDVKRFSIVCGFTYL